MTTSAQLDELSINTIRTLSMDAVEKAKSGHPGAPMALAPLAYLLYTRVMKHHLEPGDCLSAHPSDLAPALAASEATVVVRSRAGERELPLLDLYRRPSEENRSLVVLGAGEIVTAVRLPAAPEASAYLRAGERQAFSFPLVSVAAARRAGVIQLVAAGVANVPRRLLPSDPLEGLPGNPQSAWKRQVLATLVERAVAAIA